MKFMFQLPLVLCMFFNPACAGAHEKNEPVILVGCTPGDEQIKSPLGIPSSTMVDFIRWELYLYNVKPNDFELHIGFGESKPNSLGFKEGEQKKTITGQYEIAKTNGNEIYRLKSKQLADEIHLVKLNANLFQVLTTKNHLMAGNGGWSYTLNNRNPVNSPTFLPVLSPNFNPMPDTAEELIYEGRTPCLELAKDYGLMVNSSCFKLKWKLVLNRDAVKHQPTTYTIRKVVDNMPKDVSGNWTMIKGSKTNPNVYLIQLDPEKQGQAITLLVGDENILYFLKGDQTMFVGNENFSYTLNKRKAEPHNFEGSVK